MKVIVAYMSSLEGLREALSLYELGYRSSDLAQNVHGCHPHPTPDVVDNQVSHQCIPSVASCLGTRHLRVL